MADYLPLIIAHRRPLLAGAVGLVTARCAAAGDAAAAARPTPEPRAGDDPRRRGHRRAAPSRTPTGPSTDPGAATARPTLERPESTAGRLVRLRQRLARSQSPLGRGLLALLSRDRLDEDTWEEIEDTLITADVGVAPTQELVERLRTRSGSRAAAATVRDILREELLTLVDPSLDRRSPSTGADGRPARRADGGRQRHRQDHHGRQARPGPGRRGQAGGARRRRHVPRGRRRAAHDLGRAGRRRTRARPRGQRPGQRGVRGGHARASSRRPTW